MTWLRLLRRWTVATLSIIGMTFALSSLLPFMFLHLFCHKTQDFLEWLFDDRWLTIKVDTLCQSIHDWGMRNG